ncbi:MAG TPA: GNAT family N-acetyltransferase [Ktedonobacterales bacterium]|jgi:ribosomal protein S18 acetylase RimI-like enzyme|nr:GNAT family N-acetyltransferase [Ktedonobacterales bacterium]
MAVTFRILGPEDGAALQNVAEGVFDYAVNPDLSAEFLSDPRHHLAVAIDDETGRVVGMASGVHYVHPDKPPELWVNEVGVASTHQNRGVGRHVLAALLAHGRTLGCREAWVLTDYDNTAARHMYAAVAGVEEREPTLMINIALDEGADV